MASENLSERSQKALKSLTGKGKISEADINDTSREIRLALLEADVNLEAVKDFIKKIKKEALGKKAQEDLNPRRQIIKIVDDGLTKMVREGAVSLNKPQHILTIVMMVDLQGAGKTTTIGRLANHLMKNEKAQPLLIAGDIYRPAVIDRLKQIGQQLNVPVYGENNRDVAEVIKHGLEEADKNKNDYVLIDTAGRPEIDGQLMDGLKRITAVVHPDSTLPVVDAMAGQAATQVAEGFNNDLDLAGIILIKLDGDARGGVTLSIRAVIRLPVIFTGQGEKLIDPSTFHPDRMASRILGTGDMLTLIEKAQQGYDAKKAEKMTGKMRENTFDFNDFIDQMSQVQKMGPLDQVIKMIPGLGNNSTLESIQTPEKQIFYIKAIVCSTTPEERENPDTLNPSRRRGVAASSDRSVAEANRVIKQFKQSKEMVQKMTKGDIDEFANLPGMNSPMGKMAMRSMNRRLKKNRKRRMKRIKRCRSK